MSEFTDIFGNKISSRVGDLEIIEKKIKCNICKKKSDICYKDIVYVGACGFSREMCINCADKRHKKLKLKESAGVEV